METTVKIFRNECETPNGKLAEAELHFTGGDLDGLKLIGFTIWARRDGDRHNVMFPAQEYSVNGERRRFVPLRPVADTSAHNRIRELILEAYADSKQRAEIAS